MGKKRDRMDVVMLHCPECDHRWSGPPGRVVDVPDKSHHPWDYFATCPECGAEGHQDRREQALLKAWANSTGPRTPEGLANTAKNLEGHPTPEEARRTRFNGLKHGAYAETARYFPARPGKYADCDGCPYLHTTCGLDNNPACQRKTELYLRHIVAFDSGDPGLLQGLRASMHATVTAILDAIMQDIIARGVALETPAWYYDKDGDFHLAEYVDDTGQRQLITEVNEHPLLKRMSEIIKATGMTLADSGMTMASVREQDAIEGHLAGQQGDRQTMLDYQRKQALALENMTAILSRASDRAKEDPVLIEHEAQPDG